MQVNTASAPQYGASSRLGLTRRQLVSGFAIAIGGIATHFPLLAQQSQQPGMEKPGTTPTSTRT